MQGNNLSLIFQAPDLSLDTIMWLLEEMESITELGDLHAMDFSKNANDVRKLHQEIKKKEWDVSLVDSSQGIDTEERDFGKLQAILFKRFLFPSTVSPFQSLHWFYLTPSEVYKHSGVSGSGVGSIGSRPM